MLPKTPKNTDKPLSADLEYTIKTINILRDKFNKNLQFLAPEQQGEYPATSYRTFVYIQKALQAADQYPTNLSSSIPLERLKEANQTLSKLQELELTLEKFEHDLGNIIRVLRFELYKESKAIQELIKNPEAEALAG